MNLTVLKVKLIYWKNSPKRNKAVAIQQPPLELSPKPYAFLAMKLPHVFLNRVSLTPYPSSLFLNAYL